MMEFLDYLAKDNITDSYKETRGYKNHMRAELAKKMATLLEHEINALIEKKVGGKTDAIHNIALINSSSHTELGEKISKYLGIPLTPCNLDIFSNTEVKVEINQNIRGKKAIIIASLGCVVDGKSINDLKEEVYNLIDACRRAKCGSITLVCPSYPNARQDKKDRPRVPIGASMNARIFEVLGVKQLICLDLHASQIQGYFKIPVDNMYALPVICDYLRDTYFAHQDPEEVKSKYVLVSPDNGGMKRIQAYAKALKLPHLGMHKDRDYSKSSTVLSSTLIGDGSLAKGRTALVIDDMADTFGTALKGFEALKKFGIEKIIMIVTHGVLSGPALTRIKECEILQEVIVTNSLPQTKNQMICDKIKVVDIAPLIGEAIQRSIDKESVSELFNYSASEIKTSLS